MQAIDFLTSTDPARLGEDALALVAIAYGVPPLAGAGLKALRGYAGTLTKLLLQWLLLIAFRLGNNFKPQP